jgi:Family of unknown function (DUF6464)
MILALLLCFLTLAAQLSRRELMRSRQRMNSVLELAGPANPYKRIPRDPEEHYIEGVGYIIGDLSCQYNACSPYIRCAVNPGGLCDGCRDYHGKNNSY